MHCNALIQQHLDYACQAWYPNLSDKTENKIKAIQNKYMPLCL